MNETIDKINEMQDGDHVTVTVPVGDSTIEANGTATVNIDTADFHKFVASKDFKKYDSNPNSISSKFPALKNTDIYNYVINVAASFIRKNQGVRLSNKTYSELKKTIKNNQQFDKLKSYFIGDDHKLNR